MRFLDEVAEAGYEWIEIGPYGYLPPDLHVYRRELDARGLNACAVTVIADFQDPAAWPDVERQTLGAGGLGAELGAKLLVLVEECYSDINTGEVMRPSRFAEAGFRRFVDACERVGRLATERFGLTNVLHTHAETHIEYEDQIEEFLERADPARVSILLDTGHHAYRGGDPVEFMRKHHELIPYLHLKSVDGDVQRKVKAEGCIPILPVLP